MNGVRALAVAAVTLALVVAQALGLFGGGSPSVWSPAPFLLVIPALMGVPALLVLFLFVAVFCLWSPALFRPRFSDLSQRNLRFSYGLDRTRSCTWERHRNADTA